MTCANNLCSLSVKNPLGNEKTWLPHKTISNINIVFSCYLKNGVYVFIFFFILDDVAYIDGNTDYMRKFK